MLFELTDSSFPIFHGNWWEFRECAWTGSLNEMTNSFCDRIARNNVIYRAIYKIRLLFCIAYVRWQFVCMQKEHFHMD